MLANSMDSEAIDEILARCLLIFAQRGAQIRAELRAQYGIEEGDRRMSELAREAEQQLWPNNVAIVSHTATGEIAGAVNTPDAEACVHDKQRKRHRRKQEARNPRRYSEQHG